MEFLDGAALVISAGLIASGIRGIHRREVRVPQRHQGAGAVRWAWLWIALGILFAAAVIFDVRALKSLFRLFLGAAN